MKGNELHLTLVFWREGTEQHLTFHDQEQLIAIVRRAGGPPDGVIVMDGGVPLPIDERLDESFSGKRLTLIRVASGG